MVSFHSVFTTQAFCFIEKVTRQIFRMVFKFRFEKLFLDALFVGDREKLSFSAGNGLFQLMIICANFVMLQPLSDLWNW